MNNYLPYLNQLLEYIKSYGKLPDTCSIIDFNNICLNIYNEDIKSELLDYQVQTLDLILKICNTVYENSSTVLIDDDFYDQLIELYRKYKNDFRIGAEEVQINDEVNLKYPIRYIRKEEGLKHPIIYNTLDIDNMLFYNNLSYNRKINRNDLMKQSYTYNTEISKRKVLDNQLYPKLVGTLDKCKFVLNNQAKEKGVFTEPNVKIFERDFLGKHIEMGIIDVNRIYRLIAELKYDGVSICAELEGDTIISANTRGEVKENLSADLTPIFKGFKFPHASKIKTKKRYGMKFEAIMTKYNVFRFNQLKGINYANGRTAIIGLLSSSDAYLYRDFITLIPLETTLLDESVDRETELIFLNEYFRCGEVNRYAVIEGNYMNLLFQVKRFVEEAEMMRDYIQYMYDGVVISYDDPSIRNILGRKNSVNKYSIAIKFSALKKSTIFTGYTYTVGQDGTITPMIHYNPVVFFGTVHDKASGHSYARFKELNLRKGDIIDVEYTNDVMAYVTKPDNSHNASNNNPVEEFPTKCPCCGSTLTISKSQKNIKCINLNCPERNIKRIDNMFKKLNIKDFSEAYLTKIGRFHLKELFMLNKIDVSFLGEVNSQKFIDAMNELKNRDIYDYRIIGSLGFTGIAVEKWKLIFLKYDIKNFIFNMESFPEVFHENLLNIRGIGPETVNTIFNEYEFFKEDLHFIMTMKNVKSIKLDIKNINVKKIRFSGVRDIELSNKLSNMGHNISDGSLTKDTDILLIPYETYSSSKVIKAQENNIKILTIEEFKNNLNEYLK